VSAAGSSESGESGVLRGQVAIVTGAGQGIGRGVALALAGAGAKVMAVGRTVSKCQDVVEEIAGRGGGDADRGREVDCPSEVGSAVFDPFPRF
jgi:NAD(P)-dependent dehydrogenase (short-subunit alcohol dehydrogenase family)